jgi:hypothetical protein
MRNEEVTMRSSKLLALTLVVTDQVLLFLLGIDLLSITAMVRIVARCLPGRALSPVLIGAERLGARLQMVAHGNAAVVAMLVLDPKSRPGLRPGQPATVIEEDLGRAAILTKSMNVEDI